VQQNILGQSTNVSFGFVQQQHGDGGLANKAWCSMMSMDIPFVFVDTDWTDTDRQRQTDKTENEVELPYMCESRETSALVDVLHTRRLHVVADLCHKGQFCWKESITL
jgi:hypothetical protein